MAEPVRVVIDLNDVDRAGISMILLEEASGPVRVGDEVIAEEVESGVYAPALVTRVNQTHGFALVRVRWHELRERASQVETEAQLEE